MDERIEPLCCCGPAECNLKETSNIKRKDKNMTTEMTNAKFAKEDKEFIKACDNVRTIARPVIDIKPTSRQASKYRNKKGLAYKLRKK